VRARRIVCDHAADGRSGTSRNVRPKTKSMRPQKGVQLVQDDARANPNDSLLDIEIADLAVVSREIDDQAVADRVSDQACAGPAWSDRDIVPGGGFDHGTCLFGRARKSHTERLDLIDRGVGCVKLTGEIVEPNVAPAGVEAIRLGRGN